MRKKSNRKPRPITVPFENKNIIRKGILEDLHLGTMALEANPTPESFVKLGRAFLVIVNACYLYPKVLSDEAIDIINVGLNSLDHLQHTNRDKDIWETTKEGIDSIKSAIFLAGEAIPLFTYEELNNAYKLMCSETKT